MTAIGLTHYGSTLGLYNQPVDEWARALAFYADQDERAKEARERAARERKRRER
jgi:hypothetical protein